MERCLHGGANTIEDGNSEAMMGKPSMRARCEAENWEKLASLKI